MDAHLAEQLANLRSAELAALAEAGDSARRYRRRRRQQAVAAGEAVPAWRVAIGRRLVSIGLRLGVAPKHRPTAHREARVLLGDEVFTGGPFAAC
jgi:hypothetical protein